jgi:hypothetical protein
MIDFDEIARRAEKQKLKQWVDSRKERPRRRILLPDWRDYGLFLIGLLLGLWGMFWLLILLFA